jgi:hypothetical protein
MITNAATPSILVFIRIIALVPSFGPAAFPYALIIDDASKPRTPPTTQAPAQR